MENEKFKLPKSSYEELTKIIKSYGHFKGPAGLDEVSKLISMGRTVISRNVGFLVELGILEPGNKKTISSKGKELSQALEHEMPEEIQRCWLILVFENDFMSKLVTAIKIRNGMDENTLQSHIAYSAGQPKKPDLMTGARTIIDILRAAELIKEHEGKYIVSKDDSSKAYAPSDDKNESTPISSDKSVSPPALLSSKVIETSDVQIKININVSVNCTVLELDDLGEKLKKVIDEVKPCETNLDISSEDN